MSATDGTVVVNPLTFVPYDLDWIDVPAYEFMLHAVFKYRSLADFLPYLGVAPLPLDDAAQLPRLQL